MTVSSAASRNDYVAGGSSCTFAYTFKLLDANSLLVYICDVLQSTGVYSVSGVGSVTGGTVTFSTVPGATCTVHLVRSEPYTQTVDFINHGTMDAETLEGTVDKPVMLAQQLLEQFGRVPMLAASSCVTGLSIQDPVIGFFLLWDATGTGITSGQAVTVGQLTVPAFTAGSIVYASATCTLAQDNTKLFWNSTTKRMGLGTSTLSLAKVTVAPDAVLEAGVRANVTTTGGVGLYAVSASTSQPAIVAEATCNYAAEFFNLTDQGSDAANVVAVAVNGQSVYAQAGLFQQGAIAGTGSTLARNSVYPALDVSRVTGSLNSFNYTCAVLRVTDSTTSTGPLVQVLKGSTERFAIDKNGTIQTCDLRVSTCSTGTPPIGAVYEQSLLKALVVFDGTAVNPITPTFSYNIRDTRVTKIGTGDYCVTFLRAFSSAPGLATAVSNDAAAENYIVNVISLSTTVAHVQVRSGVTALTDRTYVSLSFFGNQA